MLFDTVPASLQADVVRMVDRATDPLAPTFLRRFSDFVSLPEIVRVGILNRLHDGGWSYEWQGVDLVVVGGVS